MPYEPDERILWAFKRAITTALGTNSWADLQSALPAANSGANVADFARGIIAGVRASITDFVRENINGVVQAGTLIMNFYGLVYNADMWFQLLKVWSASPGTGLDEFANFLQSEHPDLYNALVSLSGLRERFDALINTFQADTGQGPWPPAAFQIATFVSGLANTMGLQLQPIISDIVAKKGSPADQGDIIGRLVSRVIIEAVAIASGLFALVAGAASASRAAIVGIRSVLAETKEIQIAVQLAESVTPGITQAASAAGSSVKDAVEIYDRLAYKISSYNDLRSDTAAFNKTVRDIAGFQKYDWQYVSMRLDAHHIVENTWYKNFAKDFERVFGWKSSGEMDSIALHYEWHIRSGDRMAELGYLGAEDQSSLTTALQNYLDNAQAQKPFANLTDLFQAHANFYQNYGSKLWDKVQPWFQDAMAKIAAAKP